MTKRLMLSVVTILVLSFTPTFSFGQAVFGSIFGTVTDPQGAAVPNAKVTVTDTAKGTSDVYTTNDSGNYSATHLIPDTYSVTIEAQGFKTFQQKTVTVAADQSQRVDAQVQVGSTAETVEVSGEAPQLQTDRADVAIQFNQAYVQDLPTYNRNFTDFELMTPGTQKLVGWSHAATENPQGGQQIFANGQHFSGTGFELDGTCNQDPILGIIVVNPNIDAVTETKIAMQDYDAEKGNAVAGNVSAQTRSGTQRDPWRSVFWYRRSGANQARDPFTQYAPDPTDRPLHSGQQVAAVRRHHRRPDHQEQTVLLRRLPGHTAIDRRDQRAYRPDSSDAHDLYGRHRLLRYEPVSWPNRWRR